MKKEQFLIDFFKEDDFIEVQCVWLQNELKQKNQYKDTIKKLLAKIDGLEARYELITLLNSKTNLKLDERA